MKSVFRIVALISTAMLGVLVGVGTAHATDQISDNFIIKGNNYSLIGITGGGLASPTQFGMTAEMIHTACYRGYYATYEIMGEYLYLRKFTLREKYGNYLPISGVSPMINKEGYQATYSDLNVFVEFTGRIRLAKDLVGNLYARSGHQSPSAFKTVLDLTLKNGQVVEVKDRSEEMEKILGAYE